jgi:serine/threonine-protein kinase HipA
LSTSETKQGYIGRRKLYVYLQRPDTGEWVTVGRHLAPGMLLPGSFEYAPSYAEAGLAWAIDPVNLPFIPGRRFEAPRYAGLHDVLRDACPDAWGQALIRREHALPADEQPLRYLLLSSNADRWGALAVGGRPKPSFAELNAPTLPQLGDLVEELVALVEDRPALRPALRRRLIQTASVGGARPKATVRDPEGRLWLAKPRVPADVTDIPMLEHATHRWGAAAGLRFAPAELHTQGRSVVLVRRFDREKGRRRMCVSAASLLQAEYPGDYARDDRWSYPRLAEELKRIGAPPEDRIELFGRMVFNAMCGNDDDHVRNHAVVWNESERRWRLSPAFDVVPNPLETPARLAMQLSTGRVDISREAALADAHRFGLDGRAEAEHYLDALVLRIGHAFDAAAVALNERWREELLARLRTNRERLTSGAAKQAT